MELVPYLLVSFGHPSRIDYGTGHETSFVVWLCESSLWHTASYRRTGDPLAHSISSPVLSDSFLVWQELATVDRVDEVTLSVLVALHATCSDALALVTAEPLQAVCSSWDVLPKMIWRRQFCRSFTGMKCEGRCCDEGL